MAGAACILDLDGTVWDSHPWYQRALERCIGRRAEEVGDALLEGQSIVRVVESYGVTRTSFVRALRATCDGALYPGIADAIRTVAAKGMPLGVHTSLPGWIAEPLLAQTGLAPFFGQAVIHAGNCRARKPSPVGLLAALRVLDTEPSDRVFYVGDRAVDAETAMAAGVRFVWAEYGYGERRPSYTAISLKRAEDLTWL